MDGEKALGQETELVLSKLRPILKDACTAEEWERINAELGQRACEAMKKIASNVTILEGGIVANKDRWPMNIHLGRLEVGVETAPLNVDIYGTLSTSRRTRMRAYTYVFNRIYSATAQSIVKVYGKRLLTTIYNGFCGDGTSVDERLAVYRSMAETARMVAEGTC